MNIYHKKVENINEYSDGLKLMFDRIAKFKPDLLFVYNGLDPLANDRMGGVSGFDEGYLFERNKSVNNFIKEHNLPVCEFIGGGYIDYSKTDKEIEEAKVRLTDLFVSSSATVLGL